MDALRAALSSSTGTFTLFVVAAYLRASRRCLFPIRPSRKFTQPKAGWFAFGTTILVIYSLLLNSSGIDLGKALGVYVVLFFLTAQLVAELQFGHNPTLPIYLGGAFIMLGGLIMALWKHLAMAAAS